MSAIFESETLAPTARLLLLALADHADDSGRCYPSIARLCRRTGLSERAAQNNIKKMVDAGYINIVKGGGKGNTNLYFISANPALDAPRTICTPAADAPQTPQQVQVNPAPYAPEPSVTINEPSEVPLVVPREKKPDKARLPEEWALSDAAMEYAISLELLENEIEEIKNDFHAYWTDRTDAGGRKSEKGWEAAWRNRCRDQAPRFKRSRSMAFPSGSGGRGQGGSIASIVARRHAGG